MGATVTLTISRGYALPALDSDTQVITTSAVGPDSPGDFLPSDGLTVEFVRVHLLKASTGFGFTVADCDQVRAGAFPPWIHCLRVVALSASVSSRRLKTELRILKAGRRRT